MLCFWSAPAPRGCRPFLCSERAKRQQILSFAVHRAGYRPHWENRTPWATHPHKPWSYQLNPALFLVVKEMRSSRKDWLLLYSTTLNSHTALAVVTAWHICPEPFSSWTSCSLQEKQQGNFCSDVDLKDGREFRGSTMWSHSSRSFGWEKTHRHTSLLCNQDF